MMGEFSKLWRGVLLAPPTVGAAIGRALAHAFPASASPESQPEFREILDGASERRP